MENFTWFQYYLLFLGGFTFFYWVVSHWFFSDLYHKMLGFKSGSYPRSFVKIIGTSGILPSIVVILTAFNPAKYSVLMVEWLAFMFLLAVNYFHLILKKDFPKREYINILLILGNIIFITAFFPWKFN